MEFQLVLVIVGGPLFYLKLATITLVESNCQWRFFLAHVVSKSSPTDWNHGLAGWITCVFYLVENF